jgi:hypothetical protein
MTFKAEGDPRDFGDSTYRYIVDSSHARRVVRATMVQFTFGSPKVAAIFFVQILAVVVMIALVTVGGPIPAWAPIVVLVALLYSLVIQPIRTYLLAVRQVRSEYRLGEILETHFGPDSFEFIRQAGTSLRSYESIAAVSTWLGIAVVNGEKSRDFIALVSQLCPPDQVRWLQSRLGTKRSKSPRLN